MVIDLSILYKGFYVNQKGEVDLISNMVKDLLNIDCCVVMGANIANEVACENFCEATIGIYFLYLTPYLKLLNFILKFI
jgi:glycerol-3-phosphate dehydrogenase